MPVERVEALCAGFFFMVKTHSISGDLESLE